VGVGGTGVAVGAGPAHAASNNRINIKPII